MLTEEGGKLEEITSYAGVFLRPVHRVIDDASDSTITVLPPDDLGELPWLGEETGESRYPITTLKELLEERGLWRESQHIDALDIDWVHKDGQTIIVVEGIPVVELDVPLMQKVTKEIGNMGGTSIAGYSLYCMFVSSLVRHKNLAAAIKSVETWRQRYPKTRDQEVRSFYLGFLLNLPVEYVTYLGSESLDAALANLEVPWEEV